MDIKQLSNENARIIADTWHYPDQYAFYDLQADPEDYQEIIDPLARKDCYFQVTKDHHLIGYFVVDGTSDVLDIGLGLRPDLTGQGFGKIFWNQIFVYIRNHYTAPKIRLAVAEFNVRAQKLYAKVGFKETRRFLQTTNGGQYPFIEMERELS